MQDTFLQTKILNIHICVFEPQFVQLMPSA